MDPAYITYANYVDSFLESEEIEKFKSNQNYTYMLEHVDLLQGNAYLDYLERDTKITSEDICTFSSLNDSIGKPNKETFKIGILSPSNLRYLFHAHLILTHMQNLGKRSPHIVEVGGGYGGLCLAINFLCNRYSVKPQSYTIIDLEPASKLQKKFLNKFTLVFPTFFELSDTYGKDIPFTDMFLISNYCFSEISKKNQIGYINNLFSKCKNGFMAWNFIPVYDFGFEMHIETEYPMTGNEFSKYVWF